MRVTGIKPNSNYIFTCWVAWDDGFEGDTGIVDFDNVSSEGGGYIPGNNYGDDVGLDELEDGGRILNNNSKSKIGIKQPPNTDLRGSFKESEEDRILATKEVGGLTWYRLYSLVQTDQSADTGTMFIHVGKNIGNLKPSLNPLGRRYFTDLRFEEVESLSDVETKKHLDKLKLEVDINSLLGYPNIKSKPINPTVKIVEDESPEPMRELPSAVNELTNKIQSINIEDLLGKTFPDASAPPTTPTPINYNTVMEDEDKFSVPSVASNDEGPPEVLHSQQKSAPHRKSVYRSMLSRTKKKGSRGPKRTISTKGKTSTTGLSIGRKQAKFNRKKKNRLKRSKRRWSIFRKK